jgi:hypothetical protein
MALAGKETDNEAKNAVLALLASRRAQSMRRGFAQVKIGVFFGYLKIR